MSRWHLRRFRAMSWGERRLRAARHLRNLRHRRLVSHRGPEAVTGPPPSPDLFLATWIETPWLFTPARIARIAERIPGSWRERTLREADEILAGRWRWLGTLHDLGVRPRWRREPVSGVSFPAVHWSILRPVSEDGAWDLKHLWEPNLHPGFVTLAKAYLYSGQDGYRDHLERIWKDWIEQNPPLCGPNLLAPVEIGLRLVHWAAALRFLAARRAPDPAFLSAVFRSVFFQRFTLAGNLSRFSSANNHLLGELATLVLTDTAFPGLASPAETDRFEQELQDEILRQFHTDGGNREQAFHYHAFALSFGLLGAQLARERGRPWPQAVLDRLRAAVQFLDAGLDRRDRPFLYGDSDESEVLPLAEGERNLYLSLLGHARALFAPRSDGEPAPPIGYLSPRGDERTAWLAGEIGLPDSPAATPRREPETAVFPESGHLFLRRGPVEVHFNAAELGYLSIAAHAHADALSVQIRRDGVPVIVDPGTYSYRGGNAWREFLVSTAAHPTITVDDANQAERLGPFLWGRRYHTRLETDSPASPAGSPDGAPGIVTAEHDGYRGLGVVHRRRVTLRKDGSVQVDDELQGAGSHRVRLTWPLGPGSAGEIEHGATVTENRFVARLRVEGLPGPTRLVRGDPGVPGTPCFSPGYDRLEPGWALLWEGEMDLPASFRTVIEFLETEPGTPVS